MAKLTYRSRDQRPAPKNRNQGFSLVVVLIFMLVIVMIGITGMQAAGLQNAWSGTAATAQSHSRPMKPGCAAEKNTRWTWTPTTPAIRAPTLLLAGQRARCLFLQLDRREVHGYSQRIAESAQQQARGSSAVFRRIREPGAQIRKQGRLAGVPGHGSRRRQQVITSL